MMEEAKMFIEKVSTEIVILEQKIKVVGLSLEMFGFPKKVEKLGDMWGVYESKYRKNVPNIITPIVNYGFWFIKPDGDYDYFEGSAVTALGDINSELTSSAIPAGKYIKVSFNAKDFGDLVCGDGIKNGFNIAKKYAEDNNLKIKSMLAGIEVYPHELMCVGEENGPEWGLKIDNTYITTPITQYPEMYILMPIE